MAVDMFGFFFNRCLPLGMERGVDWVWEGQNQCLIPLNWSPSSTYSLRSWPSTPGASTAWLCPQRERCIPGGRGKMENWVTVTEGKSFLPASPFSISLLLIVMSNLDGFIQLKL